MTLIDFLPALGEISVIIGLLIMVLLACLRFDHRTTFLDYVGPVICLIAIVVLYLMPEQHSHTFNGTYVGDLFSKVGKFIILTLMIGIYLMTGRVKAYEHLKSFEFMILLMFSLCATMIMLSAVDFIVLYICLEILSLSSCVILAMNKENAKSLEGAVKYFIVGTVATLFFLMGVSFLYGATGSTHFDNIATDIHTAIVSYKNLSFIMLGTLFIVIAFVMKLGLAPIHFWVPDVYQAGTLSAVMLISTTPKLAQIFVFMRILYQTLSDVAFMWKPLLGCVAFLSFIFGTFGALHQKHIRRFLGYSATANFAFILFGLCVGTEVGTASAYFYSIIYVLTNFCIFAVLMVLETKGHHIEQIDHLALVTKHHPFMACILALLILSLSGFPLTPGFFAKVYVLYAGVAQELYAVTGIAIMTSVVATGYYFRLIKNLVSHREDLNPTYLVQNISPVLKTTLFAGVALLFGSLFVLNLCVIISHKTAVSLMN